jgi:hypothetical protein
MIIRGGAFGGLNEESWNSIFATWLRIVVVKLSCFMAGASFTTHRFWTAIRLMLKLSDCPVNKSVRLEGRIR